MWCRGGWGEGGREGGVWRRVAGAPSNRSDYFKALIDSYLHIYKQAPATTTPITPVVTPATGGSSSSGGKFFQNADGVRKEGMG